MHDALRLMRMPVLNLFLVFKIIQQYWIWKSWYEMKNTKLNYPCCIKYGYVEILYMKKLFRDPPRYLSCISYIRNVNIVRESLFLWNCFL